MNKYNWYHIINNYIYIYIYIYMNAHNNFTKISYSQNWCYTPGFWKRVIYNVLFAKQFLDFLKKAKKQHIRTAACQVLHTHTFKELRIMKANNQANMHQLEYWDRK